jgi:succinate dehydrogenase / fumarate reductase membrane anchor subunit
MTLRSPLGRARGMGSARKGADLWWLQRVTAVALIPLSLWLMASLVSLTGADHARFSEWVASPINAVALLLAISTSFYHFKVGMDVVIEDYVHSEGIKIASLLFTTFATVLVGAVCAFAVLKLAL